MGVETSVSAGGAAAADGTEGGERTRAGRMPRTGHPSGSGTWLDPGPPAVGGGPGYGAFIDSLRGFLDRVAAAEPDEAALRALTDDIAVWSQRLRGYEVGERKQVFARRWDLHGRGQTMSPKFVAEEYDDHSVQGTVTYGRYYLGANGAVHGGTIPLLFDEVMGRLANTGGRPRSRTAYLHTDFRSVTPVGVPLTVRAWFEGEEGRKRIVRAEIRDGETLCAEAHGLFLALLDGQP